MGDGARIDRDMPSQLRSQVFPIDVGNRNFRTECFEDALNGAIVDVIERFGVNADLSHCRIGSKLCLEVPGTLAYAVGAYHSRSSAFVTVRRPVEGGQGTCARGR